MFRHLVAAALAPLFGLFIVCVGNGFASSLTTLRLDAAGASATAVGLVSSSYFIGLTLGAIFNDRLIVRIGHIRAYSAFAALIAVSVLVQSLFVDVWGWFFLRLVYGWAIVGVFLVVESWLLLAADAKMRGRLLAFYMIALYGSSMIGQAQLGALDAWGTEAPFLLAGILAILSLLPIVLLPRHSPHVERVEPLSPLKLLRMSPTGVISCFTSGLAIAAVYTLLPLYLQRIGLTVGEIGTMMAATICGAMVLQYPVGRWSDKRGRLSVLIVLGALCTALSVAVLLLPPTPVVLMVLLFLIGGGIFAIYPVAVSHAADRAQAESLVPMIQGLLLINSIGSAMSPIAISGMMARIGPNGLFWAFAGMHLALLAFLVWRRKERPEPVPVAPFAAAAQMSPTGVEMRVTEELVQGALDREAVEETGRPAGS